MQIWNKKKYVFVSVLGYLFIFLYFVELFCYCVALLVCDYIRAGYCFSNDDLFNIVLSLILADSLFLWKRGK